jgi:hypothetical protein
MAKRKRVRTLMDDFFYFHMKDHPEICLIFYAYLYHILVQGPVTPLPTELRLSVEDILSELDLQPTGTLQALKRTVDGLYLAQAKWDSLYPLTRENLRFLAQNWAWATFHFEHQHRNVANMDIRELIYLAILKQTYQDGKIVQLLVYTGDAKFDSGLPALDPTNSLEPLIIDLTQIDPEIIMNHPEIHIRILIIFNHRIDAATKAAFLVKELKALKALGNRKRLNYYYSMIIRGTTMQNSEALDLMQVELDKMDDVREDLSKNPFYVRWKREGKAEGREEGMVKAALRLMQSQSWSVEQTTSVLGLSAEELELLLKSLQNGNGNGRY